MNIEVTSLSEHEITFVAEAQLPTRGVMYTEFPVPFYFTVVDPVESLGKCQEKDIIILH